MNPNSFNQADFLLMNQDSTSEESKSDLSNKVKNSLKSGFGSIMGIFGDSKQEKKKEAQKGDKKIMDFDPPSSRSSFSMSMYVEST